MDAARQLGARVVIAVKVIFATQEAAPRTAVGILFRALPIAFHRLRSIETAQADVATAPDSGHLAAGSVPLEGGAK